MENNINKIVQELQKEVKVLSEKLNKIEERVEKLRDYHNKSIEKMGSLKREHIW